MKKNLPTSQSTASTKFSSKSKPTLASSHEKLSLDIAKFDFKSIGPSSVVGSAHNYSPTAAALEKAGLTSFKAKSPRTNMNPLGLSIEASEPKETYTIDKRIHPHSTKAVISSTLAPNANKQSKKNSSSNEKVALNKSKDAKLVVSNYEAFLSKKKSQNHEGIVTGHSILDRRDSKRIMEEPPKKFSMPTNIASSLNSMYNTGSNSYRGNVTSVPAEQAHSSHPRPYVYVPLNPRNSQKSETETDQQSQEQAQNAKGMHYQTNNFLTDLATVPHEYVKRVSKGNIANTSNPKLNGELGQHKEEMSHHNEMLKMVNNRNKEIHSLTQHLSILSEKVQTVERKKYQLREKDKEIEELKTSINQAEDLKKELQKEFMAEQDSKLHNSQTYQESKKAKNSPSVSDIDGIRTSINQLRPGTDLPEVFETIEQKNRMLEAITKNKLFNSKKQENSYPLLEPDTHQEKDSQIFENAFLVKKMNENISQDTMKNPSKKTDKVAGTKTNKPSALTKKLLPDSHGLKLTSPSNFASKEKDSLLGTPRKIETTTNKTKKPTRLNTTSGVDSELPKRKFSHEPRAITEGLTELFGKKQSAVEAGSTFAYTAEREPVGEYVDMGRALGDLKDRIAKLLFRDREDHKKLRMVLSMYTQKLERLKNDDECECGKIRKLQ